MQAKSELTVQPSLSAVLFFLSALKLQNTSRIFSSKTTGEFALPPPGISV
jgi:hypothetical protein